MQRTTLLALLVVWGCLGQLHAQAIPSLILFNGKIFTSDKAKLNVEAIAISGERIVAVGPTSQITKLAGAKTRSIDLRGRTVIPGINDAHFHFMPKPSGIDLQFKSNEPSWDEVAEKIGQAVKQTSQGKWIFATIGGDAMADARANRFSLDRVAPDNPVLLETYYGHGQIVNSAAMSRLKISENASDPLGGRFEHDAKTKEFNGRIFEYAQWRQNRDLADQISDEEAIADLKKLGHEASRFGITSMQIMPTMRVDRFVRLLEKSDLPIRVRAMPFSLTTPGNRDLSEIRSLASLGSNSKVKASGIKWILDGTPFERGAALRRPYNDMPTVSGELNFPEDEIPKMVREARAFKQQLLVHCAGDRPVSRLFAAMEAEKRTDWKDLRWRVEHGDGLTKELFRKARKLGIIVVQNPTHLSMVKMLFARYGAQTEFFDLRSFLDAGIPLALGSDGPMNPFLNIMFATIDPVRPSEAITRDEALEAYTIGSAFAEFAEKDKGTLTAGKLADLAVLSDDIFAMPVPELPKTHSILTIMGGAIVYDEGVLK